MSLLIILMVVAIMETFRLGVVDPFHMDNRRFSDELAKKISGNSEFHIGYSPLPRRIADIMSFRHLMMLMRELSGSKIGGASFLNPKKSNPIVCASLAFSNNGKSRYMAYEMDDGGALNYLNEFIRENIPVIRVEKIGKTLFLYGIQGDVLHKQDIVDTEQDATSKPGDAP